MTHIYTTLVQLCVVKRSVIFKASQLWNQLSAELKQLPFQGLYLNVS